MPDIYTSADGQATVDLQANNAAYESEVRRLRKAAEDWHDLAVGAESRAESLRKENDILRNTLHKILAWGQASTVIDSYRIKLLAAKALRGEVK